MRENILLNTQLNEFWCFECVTLAEKRNILGKSKPKLYDSGLVASLSETFTIRYNLV